MALNAEELKNKKRWWTYPLWLMAVFGTVAWVSYAIALTVPLVTRCSSNWGIWVPFTTWEPAYSFQACLELNEFGDFLAGTFAPLAFLWLVLAVILQSAELKEQRLALIAQLEEAQELTKMQAAELALSRARTEREKFEALLKVLRKPLNSISSVDLRREPNDASFFTNHGEDKIRSIEHGVAHLEGGIEFGQSHGGLLRAYNVGLALLPHVEQLEQLQVQLSGHDKMSFNACHMPYLIRVLERMKTLEMNRPNDNE